MDPLNKPCSRCGETIQQHKLHDCQLQEIEALPEHKDPHAYFMAADGWIRHAALFCDASPVLRDSQSMRGNA